MTRLNWSLRYFLGKRDSMCSLGMLVEHINCYLLPKFYSIGTKYKMTQPLTCLLNRLMYFDKVKVFYFILFEKLKNFMWPFALVTEHQNGDHWPISPSHLSHQNWLSFGQEGSLRHTHGATQGHKCLHATMHRGREDAGSQVDIHTCTDTCMYSN